MDKNTFLAFFLIMIVLLFTPRYMELVAPQQQDSDQRVDSLLSQRPDQYAEKPIHNKTKALEKSRISTSQAKVEKQKEILTTIKTPLYTATISSFCGGSITKMTMNNYTKEIVDENNNTLTLAVEWMEVRCSEVLLKTPLTKSFGWIKVHPMEFTLLQRN